MQEHEKTQDDNPGKNQKGKDADIGAWLMKAIGEQQGEHNENKADRSNEETEVAEPVSMKTFNHRVLPQDIVQSAVVFGLPSSAEMAETKWIYGL
jgi:hypothetical protein